MRKPTLFGKYLLLERVNVGGMAEVFIAKAFGVEGFERILAIKKILPTMAEDEEFITMFIDEARISVQLNHANVVHIHELGKHDDAYFIAMEYVSGRDLRTMLERYRRRKEIMPTAQAVYVCSKICEGLDYAHRKKDARGQELHIIHRDVSPQNILCSYEGEVKIIDFGIAKAANRSQKTQAGILKGKFGYMSPEQVRGLPIDRRSDIFAVGVILYEMLTGEKLFVGESDFSTLEKVRNADVPAPRTFNPNVPAGLEKVVLKSLAREAEDRYQWASDLQEDLMRFLLAGDAIYSAKHLSSFMKDAFAEDLLREGEKMERFSNIERPDQIESSGVTAQADRPRKRSQAVLPTLPTASSAPLPSARKSSTALPVARPSINGGAGAMAMGLQSNATLNIPPPSADELAEMDGAADRTQIVDASMALDGKTSIGLSPNGFGPEQTGPVPSPIPQPEMISEVPTGSFDVTMAPRSGVSLASDTASTSLANPANGGSASVISSLNPMLDTGNDLRPLDQTGFRPAHEHLGDDDVDAATSAARPRVLDETLIPQNNRTGQKPKIVIGDGRAYSGATVVGPSPLSNPQPDDDDSRGNGKVRETRAFHEPQPEEENFDEPDPADRTNGALRLNADAGEAEEEQQQEQYDDEPPPDEEPLEDQQQLATGQRRRPLQANPAAPPGSNKKVFIIGGAITGLLIIVLAVVGVVMLGANPGRLMVGINPKGAFSVTVTPGKTYDGDQPISLEAGKYTVEVIPNNKGYQHETFRIDLGADQTVSKLVTLKPVGPKVAPPVEPANDEKSGANEPANAPDTKAADQKTAQAEPKANDQRPVEAKPIEKASSYTALFACDESGVQVFVDGKPVGKTPGLKVPGLSFKVHEVQASKPGFITINLKMDNADRAETFDQVLTMTREAKDPRPEPKPRPVVENKPEPVKPVAVEAKPKPEPKPEVAKVTAPPPEPKPTQAAQPTQPTQAAADPKKPDAKDTAPKPNGKSKGKFACSTKPVGAEVWIDGKNTGLKTPITLSNAVELSTGKHKVLFKMGSKQSGPHEVNVPENEIAKLTGIAIE